MRAINSEYIHDNNSVKIANVIRKVTSNANANKNGSSISMSEQWLNDHNINSIDKLNETNKWFFLLKLNPPSSLPSYQPHQA